MVARMILSSTDILVMLSVCYVARRTLKVDARLRSCFQLKESLSFHTVPNQMNEVRPGTRCMVDAATYKRQ